MRRLSHLLVVLLERAFGRRHVVRAARFVWLAARRDGTNDMARNGESLVQRLLATSAENAVVLDVGAHYGEWTDQLLEVSGRSDLVVHCFEPSTTTFDALDKHMTGVRGVTCHRTALGASVGLATLHIVHDGAGSNSLLPGSGASHSAIESVAVTTLDDFCGNEIPSVELLKIDAEGFDLLVLHGATQLLERQAIRLIQFEYNVRWVFARTYLKDAFDLLMPYGYRVGKVTPEGLELYESWHPELETFREANYLAFPANRVPALRQVPWWGP